MDKMEVGTEKPDPNDSDDENYLECLLANISYDKTHSDTKDSDTAKRAQPNNSHDKNFHCLPKNVSNETDSETAKPNSNNSDDKNFYCLPTKVSNETDLEAAKPDSNNSHDKNFHCLPAKVSNETDSEAAKPDSNNPVHRDDLVRLLEDVLDETDSNAADEEIDTSRRWDEMDEAAKDKLLAIAHQRNDALTYSLQAELPHVPLPLEEIQAYCKLKDFQDNRIKNVHTAGTLSLINVLWAKLGVDISEEKYASISLDISRLRDVLSNDSVNGKMLRLGKAARIFGKLEIQRKEIVIVVEQILPLENIESYRTTLRVAFKVAKQRIDQYLYDTDNSITYMVATIEWRKRERERLEKLLARKLMKEEKRRKAKEEENQLKTCEPMEVEECGEPEVLNANEKMRRIIREEKAAKIEASENEGRGEEQMELITQINMERAWKKNVEPKLWKRILDIWKSDLNKS